ncbi:MAG: hypothetical protein ACLR9Q_05900 [Enterocloster sp.]
MGKCGEKYLPSVRSGDMEMIAWWRNIECLVAKREFEQFYEEIEKFEAEIDLDDRVNWQAVMRIRAVADFYENKISAADKRQRMEEALRCTVPGYKDGLVPKGVFSRTEIRIFCNIAVSYAEEGKYEIALSMMEQIQQYYVDTAIDGLERAKGEVLALSNYAQCLGRYGDSKKAIQIGEKAMKLCLKEKKADVLANILYNIAFEKELLGYDEKECKELLLQAYYVAELNGNYQKMQHIKNHMSKN